MIILTYKRFSWIFLLALCALAMRLEAQPTSVRSDIQIKQIAGLNRNTVRVCRDPASGNLYTLENTGNIRRVDFNANGTASLTVVYRTSDHGLSAPLGIAFDKNGTMFLVGNESNGQSRTATIVRGVPDSPGSEVRTWTVLAKTVPYLFGFTYNHKMSAMVVDPTGNYIYVNSGARTDHGEMREGYREVGLTDIFLKLPVNGQDITLQDDREWLRTNGYLLVEGIRNCFDMAYAGNGDLFSVENSGDRDDPEEMNWIREGLFYGFSWRIGGNDTPQQYTPYDPKSDPLLSPNAWGGGTLYTTFSNDPNYPPRPDGVSFTEPIPSSGPDADKFRDPQTGEVKDASDLGVTITTFSTHRSPDGIVFDRDSVLTEDLAGGAFVISLANGALLQALGDHGEDLLHVALTKGGESGYSAKVTRLVSGFHAPLGIELVGNKLYVAETGLWNNYNSPKLWELTLPLKPTSGVFQGHDDSVPGIFSLANYPNPFNPETTISFAIPVDAKVRISIYDAMGRKVRTLFDDRLNPGEYTRVWNGKDDRDQAVASGVYLIRMRADDFAAVLKIALVK